MNKISIFLFSFFVANLHCSLLVNDTALFPDDTTEVTEEKKRAALHPRCSFLGSIALGALLAASGFALALNSLDKFHNIPEVLGISGIVTGIWGMYAGHRVIKRTLVMHLP